MTLWPSAAGIARLVRAWSLVIGAIKLASTLPWHSRRPLSADPPEACSGIITVLGNILYRFITC